MAIKYLARGATSFASPNWSGGALADEDDAIIEFPFGQITAGLDQSGFTSGLQSLRINPGATAGRIGGGSHGSFIVDVDHGTPYVANLGAVELFITAGGNNSLVTNLGQSGPGSTNLTGGTFTNVTASRGILNANGSAVITNFAAGGGSGEIQYHATPMTTARIHGGTWIIRRAVTTMTISGNATVIYDPDDAATIAGTAIVTRGGRLIHMAGATPTIDNEGGVHDFSQARRAFTPGGTAWRWLFTQIIRSSAVSFTNLTPLYGYQVSPDGPMPL